MIKAENIRTANFHEDGVFVNNVFYGYKDYSPEFFKELMNQIRIAGSTSFEAVRERRNFKNRK